MVRRSLYTKYCLYQTFCRSILDYSFLERVNAKFRRIQVQPQSQAITQQQQQPIKQRKSCVND